jgi:hypothetical protein
MFSQNTTDTLSVRSNPITYIDLLGGYTNGEIKGYSFGTSLNMQNNKDLFTFRTLYSAEINKDVNFLEALSIAPLFKGGNSINEYAVLYGKRFIDNNLAYSISLGISSNLKKHKVVQNNSKIWIRNQYIGIPFEINFNLFKPRKKRFRALYGLVPLGKPTGFGRSFGFKLYGNIAKTSYIGIGLTFGYGWHKKY